MSVYFNITNIKYTNKNTNSVLVDMDFIIVGCGGRYLCKQVKHVYIQMQSQTITSRTCKCCLYSYLNTHDMFTI